MSAAYRQLETRFRRIAQLNGAMAVLHWDSATMMPDGGADTRADQLATLGVIAHERLTDPAMGDLLAKAETSGGLDDWQAANLRAMRRQWRHASAVPADLVEARSLATSQAEMVWRTARAANDFKALLAPWQKVLDLTREAAQAKAAAFNLSPYDALLDEYEPGGRAAMLEPLLDALASRLPALVDRILERQASRGPAQALAGPFSIPAQRELGLDFMRALGFDFEHGRLDISHHPFTGGVPDDVRITTRYDEADFTSALMGVLHETGHALYERGLPAAWRHQPVGDARSMTLHESQSLLIEMQVCRSDEFIGYAAPLIRDRFGGKGAAWSAANLARHYRHVERGLIRVDADEATYPLHVILRYRLEQAMIAGTLRIADLPGAWDEGMRQLVGIAPPDDRNGCMQDIHWPSGAYGYFPTYTMGAVAAAQLYAQAKRDEPEIPRAVARGEFQPLLAWLRTKVHGQGSRYSYDELMREATGRPLGLDDFLAHLETRYLS
jgi:carboxypeptidase Taq